MKPELAVQAAIEQAEPYLDPAWSKALPRLDLAALEGTKAPEQAWALKGYIPQRQATYLTGPGSAGKSLVAQQLAAITVLGRPFMGLETVQAPAIYITCEDDEHELHRRQEAICEMLGVRMGTLAGKLHLISLAGRVGSELATFESKIERDEFGGTEPLIQPSRLYHAIEGTAVALGAGLTILDNVAHFFAGNENIRNEVAAFMSLMNRLAIRTSGAVLLIGHPNKKGDNFSGSTAWENQVRSRLYMEVPDPEVDGDARVLRREKANYASRSGELRFRWHRGAFVRDEDLGPGLAAEMSSVAADNAHNDRFLACLAEKTRQQRNVSERYGGNFAPKEFMRMPEAKGSRKEDLVLAMERLFRIGRIERAELWKGPDRKPVFGLRETPAANLRETHAG